MGLMGETMTKKLDFRITDEGPVWMFEPISDTARKFVQQNVPLDKRLWIGSRFAIDHRAAEYLADQLEVEGFSLSA